MSEQSDLAYIREILERTRASVVVDTLPLMAWGALTVLGSILSTMVPRFDSVWTWVVLMGAGWIYAATRFISVSNRSRVASLAQSGIYAIWFSAYLSMTLIGFGGYSAGIIPASAISFIDAVLFGLAFFSTGVLLGSRGALLTAGAWWLVACVIAILPGAWKMPLFGCAVAALVVLPCLMYRRSNAR